MKYSVLFFQFLGGIVTILLLALLVSVSSSLLFPWKPQSSHAVIDAVEAASDLDAFLASQESSERNLKKDLAKGIEWFDPFNKTKTPYSIVYLHGFSASRKEIAPVVDVIAKKMGANVFYARFKAHGLEDGEAFGQLRAQDFIDDAEEALAIGRRIGEKVIVVAMSTGAPIALYLAQKDWAQRDLRGAAELGKSVRENAAGDGPAVAVRSGEISTLAAMILLSPNFSPRDWRARFIAGPLGPWIARRLIGNYHQFTPSNEQHARLWTPRYRSEGIAAMMDLVNYVRRSDISKIRVPALTLYTQLDQVVDVSLIEKRHESLGSPQKKLVHLKQATRHELVSDALAPELVKPTVAEIEQWLQSVL